MKEFDIEKWQEEWKGCMLDCAEDASKHLAEWLMDMLAHNSGFLNKVPLKELGLNDAQAEDFYKELYDEVLGENLLDEHFRQQVYATIKARVDSARK